MPAKGSKRKFQNRKNFLKKDLWERYVEKNDDDVTWDEFKTIVMDVLEYVAKSIVTDNLGFRLPYNMGYIAVTRYKTPKNMIDMVHLCKTGIKRPLLNLHSFEDQCRILWFSSKTVANFRNRGLYKFKASKELNYRMRDMIYAGKEYDSISSQMYMSDSQLQKLADKKTRYANEQ
jgi:hypothetical protein